MKKVIFLLLSVLFVQLSSAQDKPPTYKVVDNIIFSKKDYAVKYISIENGFTLQICAPECETTKPYSNDVSADVLTTGIINLIKEKFDSTATADPTKDEQKAKITKLLEKLKASQTADLRAAKTDLENTLSDVDRAGKLYSAKIVINKEVPYKNKGKSGSTKKPIQAGDGIYDKDDTDPESPLGTPLPKPKPIPTLTVKNALISFFNNKASTIYIEADYTKDGQTESLIFLNNSFSVPVRYFNRYGMTVTATAKNRDRIEIDYNDVFDYKSDQFFNYSIANDQIVFSTSTVDSMSQRVQQRRFYDFFTGIIYSDLLGFNTENSNSLLNAQIKLLIPMNLRNWRKLTFTRQFTTSANIALNSSFEDETRFIAIKDDETFSNFDLLKKNNLYGKINLEVLTYESKGWFLNTSLGYSAAFYRTGFRYTQTAPDTVDLVTSKQLMSLVYGPFLNFEIRPQSNFGADVTLSLESLNYNDIKSINGRDFKGDIIVQDSKNSFLFDHNLINVEANFYWLINPEKSSGGVYAKIGTYFDTASDAIFPQIMAGYATNLTSFVNRFKPKAPKPGQ